MPSPVLAAAPTWMERSIFCPSTGRDSSSRYESGRRSGVPLVPRVGAGAGSLRARRRPSSRSAVPGSSAPVGIRPAPEIVQDPEQAGVALKGLADQTRHGNLSSGEDTGEKRVRRRGPVGLHFHGRTRVATRPDVGTGLVKVHVGPERPHHRGSHRQIRAGHDLAVEPDPKSPIRGRADQHQGARELARLCGGHRDFATGQLSSGDPCEHAGARGSVDAGTEVLQRLQQRLHRSLQQAAPGPDFGRTLGCGRQCEEEPCSRAAQSGIDGSGIGSCSARVRRRRPRFDPRPVPLGCHRGAELTQ